ncbi:phage tail protein [Paenibacillus lactis]|uniref:phage tail protein n=1 Tax=Paenibacillus lactis TaxID=228574 RepID=UPI0036B0BB0F
MSFNEKLPDWGNPGTEPPESKKQTGFLPAEKPPADWFNWLFHRNYKALEELRSKAETVENKNRPDGYAGLDNTGKIPTELLPDDQEIVLPDASLTQKGIVQLSNATNGTREYVAATEKAVKDAYDRGSAGVTAAAAAQARADAAFTQANDGKGKVRTAIIGAKGTVGDADGDGIPTFDELAAGVKTILPNATADAVLDPNMLVVGYSGYDDGVKKAGQMPNRSAENHHMPGSNKTVWPGDRYFIQPPAGYYDGASWVTAAEPQLIAANIRQGASIGGVIGSLVEGRPYLSGSVSADSQWNLTIPVPGEFVVRFIILWQGNGDGSANNGVSLGYIVPQKNNGPLLNYYNDQAIGSKDAWNQSNPYRPGSVFILSNKHPNTWNYIILTD